MRLYVCMSYVCLCISMIIKNVADRFHRNFSEWLALWIKKKYSYGSYRGSPCRVSLSARRIGVPLYLIQRWRVTRTRRATL